MQYRQSSTVSYWRNNQQAGLPPPSNMGAADHWGDSGPPGKQGRPNVLKHHHDGYALTWIKAET
jgi:hypothetical protein